MATQLNSDDNTVKMIYSIADVAPHPPALSRLVFLNDKMRSPFLDAALKNAETIHVTPSSKHTQCILIRNQKRYNARTIVWWQPNINIALVRNIGNRNEDLSD